MMGRMGKRKGNRNAAGHGGVSLRDMLRESEQGRAARGRKAGKPSRPQGVGKAGKPSRAQGVGNGGRAVADPAPLHLEGDPHRRIAVIGGGAAGLAAAIAAARELRARGRFERDAVVLFEADDRVGRSILATGNGRCNFSNANIEPRLYRNAAFVAEALEALEGAASVPAHVRETAVRQDDTPFVSEDGLPVAHDAAFGSAADDELGASFDGALGPTPAFNPTGNAVLRFFAQAGLEWREEGEGRLYPATGKASTVLDALRAAAAHLGVTEARGRCAVSVEFPREEGGLFHIRFDDGAIQHAVAVVLAVGGKHAHGLLAGDTVQGKGNEAEDPLLPVSYELVSLRPVLGPLAVREAAPKQLDNIRVRAQITLVGGEDAGDSGVVKAVERGEVLFRSYGVSGICIFNLSRFAEPGDRLLIDFLPTVEEGARERALVERACRLAEGGLVECADDGVSNETLLCGLLLPQVARVVLKQAGLELGAAFHKGDAAVLARALSALPLTVEGVGDERQCQVLRGGLDVRKFDPRTMESLLHVGLFAAGEVLDVDAPCGGYNLHWAWASGLLAGMSAAQHVCANAAKQRESEDADA